MNNQKPWSYTHTVDGVEYSIPRENIIQWYAKYQGCDAWIKLVERVKKNADNICYDCNELVVKKGVVHHTSYAFWGMGNYEEESDCVYLCNKCHRKRHRTEDDSYIPFFARMHPKIMVVDSDIYLKVNI